jgi:RNA polymerase sigma-70 factor (ECF subfamily)
LPYLLQTIRNRQIDGLRAFARRGSQLSELHFPVRHDGPHQSVVEEEQNAALSEALGALPAKQRDVLTLRIFGGLSYAEIAADQAAPTATVRTRYRAAIDKLRQVLGRRVANE